MQMTMNDDCDDEANFARHRDRDHYITCVRACVLISRFSVVRHVVWHAHTYAQHLVLVLVCETRARA